MFKVKYKSDGTVDRFKARWVGCGYSQQEGRDYADTYASTLRATSFRLIIAFAIDFCHPHSRWCRALQIWLEKDPGSPRIHRLCIIQLLEADFNLLLKIIWGRRMVWHASQYHAFNNVPQFGSRP